MKRFFKQKGVSLIELLVAGFILVIVSLFVSTIFMRGSINVITAWEETTVLACMQELLEEIKGVSREYYRFIKVGTLTTNSAHHHHINIPALVRAGDNISFSVVAHDINDCRTNNTNSTPVTVIWEQKEGEGMVSCNFTGISLTDGIGLGNVTFSSNSSKPSKGVLHINSTTIGTSFDVAGIIVYPQAGEQIKDGDLIGTRTAIFELFDDPLDNTPKPDLLPGDYMKGTITFTWERRKGTGRNEKNLVTIIAPFPEE